MEDVVIATIAFVLAILAYFTYNLWLIKGKVERILKRGKLSRENKSDLEEILRIIKRL
jgi:hypothetical protein